MNRKSITVLLISLVWGVTAQAQMKKVMLYPNGDVRYDRKLLHFGFTVGLNTADFYMRNSDNFFNTTQINEIYSIENKQSAGFHLGPISNFRLGEYLDLRLLITLTFSQRDLQYTIIKDTSTKQNIEFDTHTMKLSSTFIEFPLLLKYKAQRINNFRPYVIGGMSYKLDLASKKKIPFEELPKIRLKQPDVYYEVGMGMDFYNGFFKLSVELKFAAGLSNVALTDVTQYSQTFKYLKSNVYMLSFHFE